MADSDTFRKWTARQQALIRWCAETKFTRQPETLEALADELGVTSRTLRNWKNKPGFYEQVNKLARSYLINGLPEVFAAILREAGKGSFQHARMALELAGELQQDSADGTLTIKIKYADNYTDLANAAYGAGEDNKPSITA